MPTIWTKETIADLTWVDDEDLLGAILYTEDGNPIVTEDEVSIVLEGYLTPYGKVDIEDNEWNPFGPLLYLATEGYRQRLLTEGRLVYLMVDKGDDWTEEDAGENNWTKVEIE